MIDDATIKKIAKECWPDLPDHWWDRKDGAVWNATSAFAKACYAAGQQEQKNKVSEYIMQKGFAAGHGDTITDLLDELFVQAKDAQRESDAKLCDRFAAREMHPSECASAIRTNKAP